MNSVMNSVRLFSLHNLSHRPPPPPHFPAATFHPSLSIQLNPSRPFLLSALPLFTANNNNGGSGGGGFWCNNNPFDSVDDSFSSSSGSRYTIFFTLLFSYITFCFYNLLLTKFAMANVAKNPSLSSSSSLWRGVQGVACQVSGILATQALLYAVGLGKGDIPTAAAINWVLKDEIGYLSKILLSDFGRYFDVNPKGWRLFADLLENAAFGLEMCTTAFPHLFVPIGASRSAASLIQASTRSCFFAGFAAQRNLGLEMCTAFPHLFVPIGAFAGASHSAASLIQASTRSCFFAGFAAQRNFAKGSRHVVRAASTDAFSDDDFILLPPLKLKSDPGRFLEQVLQNEPHLFAPAIDEELNKLAAADRTITHKEKRMMLEDLIYCLIMKKFKEHKIVMTRDVSEITHYPYTLEAKLEAIHTPDALAIIYSRLTVAPSYHKSEEQASLMHFIIKSGSAYLSKQQLGNLYLNSVKYTYFLKLLEERFQLEKSLNLITQDRGLMFYKLHLDDEIYGRLSRVRSMEAVLLMGRHVESIFGRLRGSIQEDFRVLMTIREFMLVVLEGAAFGKFLVDAENHVNSVCPFIDD